ncbi:MAG TPA: hypothetical protein VFV10_17345 [Gammaproteobacteria bacterium]|nr:hypothetical protein [Gammaproteobacteria bacterium]
MVQAEEVGSGRADARRSLAVLPFDNLSSDPENAYVAAGMQEEILTKLSRLANHFRVISRTSVLRYKDQRPPISTIAQELGADLILEGSVRSARDKLRVDARLVDAATDRVLWSDTYDGRRDDALSMQCAVAIDVARALRIELSAAERDSLDRALMDSARAYELYAQANYVYTSVSPNEALARRLMESALDADPSFAAALGWLEMLRWLEIAAEKVRNHEIDEGFVALNNLRMNITGDPAIERPRLRAALDRIRGD